MAMTDEEILEIVKANADVRDLVRLRLTQRDGRKKQKAMVPESAAEKLRYVSGYPSRHRYREDGSHALRLFVEGDSHISTAIRARIDVGDKHKSSPISLLNMSDKQYEIYEDAFIRIVQVLEEIGDGKTMFTDKDGIRRDIKTKEVIVEEAAT